MTLPSPLPRPSEIQPEVLETDKGSKGSEGLAAQKLNDATYEPGAHVEQSGNFHQSEAIQSTFTALVDHSAAVAQTGVKPDAGGPVSLTPIQMPRVDQGQSSGGGTKPDAGGPVSQIGRASCRERVYSNV